MDEGLGFRGVGVTGLAIPPAGFCAGEEISTSWVVLGFRLSGLGALHLQPTTKTKPCRNATLNTYPE